jgi:hypothetical protein
MNPFASRATFSLISTSKDTAPGAKSIDRLDTARHAEGGTMTLLDTIDRLCGQFATALHNSELQIFATLTLILVLSFLLFPPKNDPDQV